MAEQSSRHQNLTVHTVISEPTKLYRGLTRLVAGRLIKDLSGNIQSPSYHWINFSGSGFGSAELVAGQPRHLISRLKTAPTFLLLALSI
jgi:hypothetical protein